MFVRYAVNALLHQVTVTWTIWDYNLGDRDSLFKFEWKVASGNWQTPSDGVYATRKGTVPIAFQKVNRTVSLTGVNWGPSEHLYLSWYTNDISGSGDRDEIGLDDLTITFNVGSTTTTSTSITSSSTTDPTTSSTTSILATSSSTHGQTTSGVISTGATETTTDVSTTALISAGTSEDLGIGNQSTENFQNSQMLYYTAGGGGAVVASGALVAVLCVRRKLRKGAQISARISMEQLKRSSLRRIDDIEIKYLLGEGNFGRVWKGIWQGTTEVALKEIHEKEQFEEFENEAAVLQYVL